MKRVTVIITTYKRKKEFKKALNSVVNQTYNNIEIIVVDDNIDKEYSDYIMNVCKEAEGITYIKNKCNLGGALSRNVGLENASGYYIAFLDDDDVYYPEKITKQVNCFETSRINKLGLVYCHTVAVNKNEQIIEKYQKNITGQFLYDNMLNTVAATTQWLCLKKAVDEIGGFRNVPSKQDTTLLMDLALAGYRIDVVPEILTKYYELDIERISGVSLKNLEGELLLREHMKKHYFLLNAMQIRRVDYNVLFRIYYLQIRLNKHKDASKTLLKIIKTGLNKKNVFCLVVKHPFRKFISGVRNEKNISN